jgi:hypothetical protein
VVELHFGCGGAGQGGLLLRWHGSHVAVLSLDHPALRVCMLLAGGQARQALVWAKALEPHCHDDVALQLVDPYGPAVVEEAIPALPGEVGRGEKKRSIFGGGRRAPGLANLDHKPGRALPLPAVQQGAFVSSYFGRVITWGGDLTSGGCGCLWDGRAVGGPGHRAVHEARAGLAACRPAPRLARHARYTRPGKPQPPPTPP